MARKSTARGMAAKRVRVKGDASDLTDEKLATLWLGKATDYSGIIYGIDDIAFMYRCDSREVRQRLRKMGLR